MFALWLPGRSPAISEGDRKRYKETNTQLLSRARTEIVQQLATKNTMCVNRREPTTPNLTCCFQNYPIILIHVSNRKGIPFLFLPLIHPAQRSSPVGSLVHMLEVYRTTNLTTISICCGNAHGKTKCEHIKGCEGHVQKRREFWEGFPWWRSDSAPTTWFA